MVNTWLSHVKKTMKAHPGKPFKVILKLAKGTYKRGKSVAKYAVTGKKRRHGKGKKTRRNRRGRKGRKGRK